MIPFLTDRHAYTYFVRKEDLSQFIEEFFENPDGIAFLRQTSRKAMLAKIQTLMNQTPAEDEGMFFYLEAMGNKQYRVGGWNPSHRNTRPWLGDPIPYAPSPLLSDLFFGGDDD